MGVSHTYEMPVAQDLCEVPGMSDSADAIFNLIDHLAARYELTSIRPLLNTCRTLSTEQVLRIAVFGRFKAGKSTFLNNLVGRDLVPTGVVPVTSVVTEVGYGSHERAIVRFLDGHDEEVAADRIRSYIAEAENPENAKQVAMVRVDLPSLRRYAGIRFVDTPGLDSVFAHNTEASLNWLPNVDLALVAIGVDPPLSQQDIALIRRLYDFTPRVTVLLTKLDVLSPEDQDEVRDFVRSHLRRNFDDPPPVYPYSARPEYDYTREAIEDMIIGNVLGKFQEQRSAVLKHKTTALLRECKDYLSLALKSADALESERTALKNTVLAEKASLEEFKTQLRLLARHTAGGTRTMISKRFEPQQQRIEKELMASLEAEYPGWTRNIAYLITCFEAWLSRSLTQTLGTLSAAHRREFAESVDTLRRQSARSLQDFRARVSERTTASFGVPLRLTEIEIEETPPRAPDINVGKVFDRSWELLSWVIPMGLVKGMVRSHLLGQKLPYEVFKNLSRVTSQWEDSINTALFGVEKQAEARLDELMSTIENLLSRAKSDAPQLAADLASIEAAEASMR